MRRKSKAINVGGVKIGGGYPVSVQSMTNTPSRDFEAVIAQIQRLKDAGCDIVRVAVPDVESASIFKIAKERNIGVPLVADIHFDYKIALESVKAGADKIRINPGNIGASWKVKEVASACADGGIPIRIGVNAGSIDKKILAKYGSPTPEALAESAIGQAEALESFSFDNIVLSIKSSTVQNMISASKIVAAESEYPLHLGVTEAGTSYDGIIKNSIGIGALLTEGVGDTIRVSLTADPIEEVRAGIQILRSLGIYKNGTINVISCPTCGRTKLNLIAIAEEYKKRVSKIDTNGKNLTVAVMGCVVNGPGEARDADFGVAGGDGFGVLFKKGKPVRRVEENNIIETLMDETNVFLNCE